jgi:hypothetical protein
MSFAINSTLLAPSSIRLLGRVLSGLAPAGQNLAAPNPAAPNPAAQALGGLPPQYLGRTQLRNDIQGGLLLAHILAYSYAGTYATLQTPALFLVRNAGENVVIANRINPRHLGLVHLDPNVYFADDIRLWTYDQSDQIIRLDASNGTVQQLVIDAETGGVHGRRRIDLVGQDGSFSGRFGGGGH